MILSPIRFNRKKFPFGMLFGMDIVDWVISTTVCFLCSVFREFMLTSFEYDERAALRLLVEHGMTELLFDVAKVISLVPSSYPYPACG